MKCLISALANSVCVACLCISSISNTPARQPEQSAKADVYIVQLQGRPLGRTGAGEALYSRPRSELSARSGGVARASVPMSAERRLLEEEQGHFLQSANDVLARTLSVKSTYQNVINGFAITMTAAEAERLASMPGVISVIPNRYHELHLDRGPAFIGAADIWQGSSAGQSRGEGIVVGVIDSGINWDHPFFDEVGSDGFAISNPRGRLFGECVSRPERCNSKLIGIYDFTDEAASDGRDLDGHGSHTASTAAGTLQEITFSFSGLSPLNLSISGVAPRANVIAYKACEADTSDTGGSTTRCPFNALLDALDQALADGVDVINYSLGGDVFGTPWDGLRQPGVQGASELFLDLRTAGTLTVSSAGNSGPQPGTVSRPANTPWLISVGNITHDRFIGQQINNLAGGDTSPPEGLSGSSLTDGIGPLRIVHAGDFGNALCGIGAAELGPGCNDNRGTTNPFPPGTFNGEIVVCDRGTYGRVEKGFNVLQAGAAGMILANTDSQGERVSADAHCLPATHVGDRAGDQLRAWLTTGDNHSGGFTSATVGNSDAAGAILANSSSRGPNAEIAGVGKPNLVAPGTAVLAAGPNSDGLAFLSGTSMSSPHVAGAAALLMSAHPDWSVTQVQSALETTAQWPLPASGANAELTGNERGAGVPVLRDALRAGLYLPVTTADFRASEPAVGGDPQRLNLANIQFDNCQQTCSVNRTLRDQMGGGTWELSTDNEFLSVSPQTISLSANESAEITITATMVDSNTIGSWQTGVIEMTTVAALDGQPLTQRLPVTTRFSGGELPAVIRITSNDSQGRETIVLNDVIPMSDATWVLSNLAVPTQSTGVLSRDPTPNDPYDSAAGRRVIFLQASAAAIELRARTLFSSADDIDLYIGVDSNGNGQADESEELCASISTDTIEECSVPITTTGNYWILVQNFDASAVGNDNVTAEYAVIAMPADERERNLFIQPPGQTQAGVPVDFTLGWDIETLPNNRQAWGVLSVGTSRATAGNLGSIDIEFERSGQKSIPAVPLFAGTSEALTVPSQATLNQVYIDIPAGVESADIQLAGGRFDVQLARMAFDEALAAGPAILPAPEIAVLSVPSDSNGNVSITLDSPLLQPGRWYLVVQSNQTAEQVITASVAFASADDAKQVMPRSTAFARDGSTRSGIDFFRIGDHNGVLWFTYDEAGQPIFYNTAGLEPVAGSNVFSGTLFAFSGTGTAQQAHTVGELGMTFLSETDMIMSWKLLGASGSERMQIIAEPACSADAFERPDTTGFVNSNGLWEVVPTGQGGVTMIITPFAQGYTRYFYDDSGRGRWVSGTEQGTILDSTSGDILQFSGACPYCQPVTPVERVVGTYSHDFSSDTTASQTINFSLQSPLSGGLNNTVEIVRLSNNTNCAGQ